MDEWHRGIKLEWSLSEEVPSQITYVFLICKGIWCRMTRITVKSSSGIITTQSDSCATQWNNDEGRTSISLLSGRSRRLEQPPADVFIGCVFCLHVRLRSAHLKIYLDLFGNWSQNYLPTKTLWYRYQISQIPGVPDNVIFKVMLFLFSYNYKFISTHLPETDWE